MSKDNLGNKHVRIHVPKQNIDSLQTRKMKGLKKTVSEKKEQRKRRSDGGGEATPEKVQKV